MNRFRLSSNNLFIREEQTEKPANIIFLSVEGNNTEVDYLKHLNRNKELLGIKSRVEVEVLRRRSTDTNSDPSSVLDLLTEFVSLYNNGLDEDEFKKVLPEGCTIDMVRQYVDTPESIPRSIENDFLNKFKESADIDLAYYRYLKNKKGEDGDCFGIIIDRDSKNHSQRQLGNILKHCEAEGYLFYLSNPCFEFWLLLHLCDVKAEYEKDLDRLLENKRESNKHSYISKEIQKIAGHNKNISESKFKEHYAKNIDNAIKRAEDFESDPAKLIEGNLGCNIQELIKLLRSK